jgi:hypothetical protein
MVDDKSLKSLKSLGISARIATGLLLLGVVATIYKGYYEMKKTKLQIKLIQSELDMIKKGISGA